MLFRYKTVGKDGVQFEGSIDAFDEDAAIASLQRRGLVVVSVYPEKEASWWQESVPFFRAVSPKDIVIISRQIATLFEAKVPALQVFRLIATETDNAVLRDAFAKITDDIQAGVPISDAMEKHVEIFSDFYVNMVRSGEESGKLNETFNFLADYLDRSYELSSKAKNALIYPAFVITTFIVVMTLMLVMVIPRLGTILLETGQDIPFYTQIVIGVSNFLLNYGLVILGLIIVGVIVLWRFVRSPGGGQSLAQFQLSVPYVGQLYRKFYLSRIADNLHTMISSGIPIVRAFEVTAHVVGNAVYADILNEVKQAVQGGAPISETLVRYDEIPSIMTQMIKVGEETGRLGFVLQTMAAFYRREVDNEVSTIVSLIEPILIVALGLGVGFLLTSVLIPIYQTTANI
ncbi:MAG: hypothetical protein COW88_00200 [Candidatus Lloydbacteria bacterium CG22_combo_CG10-13_8_21_14_all_47_15]|uniref:Type II secretion system protein GspF domain-containing protein n=1 Tax=Candidatus Lloydbacteria bacterium CG22_combo_CG10-13_8_21_14_all_47_15 TaxID=1974635 RepID=A0A2H0CVP9_9BACT|nr:MAG: hypothetical protein COW88_00200 [Candidatus Lloydbacteria bacterium CG22_combo_CG10-13_8_21_14_all_47_15]